MGVNQYRGYTFIITGAAFWGLTGLFVQSLYTYGFTPVDVVAIRLILSGLIMLLYLAFFNPRYLSIKKKDLISFFSLGVIAIGFFNWCYFQVMEMENLSVAVIFVYTSPVFAMIFAALFFREKVTLVKSVSIIITVAGCGFVVGFFPNGSFNFPFFTIFLGLLSGVFASMYTIIGKYVGAVYHPLTVTTYAMLCGGLVMLPVSGVWNRSVLLLQWEVLFLLAGIVLISTIFAYTIYTLGLFYVESSKAVILSTFELIVSVSIGILIFGDNLTLWQWLGAALIIGSIFITVFFRDK